MPIALLKRPAGEHSAPIGFHARPPILPEQCVERASLKRYKVWLRDKPYTVHRRIIAAQP